MVLQLRKFYFASFIYIILCVINDMSLSLQDELYDLQNDILLKMVKKTGANFYKMLKESSYPKLRDFGFCFAFCVRIYIFMQNILFKNETYKK